MDKDCQWIRSVSRRSRLIALVGNLIVWDVKQPTHYSIRVGDVVPGVVVCIILSFALLSFCVLFFHSIQGLERFRNKKRSLSGKESGHQK